MAERKLTIMLVDDHPVIREGLTLILQAQTDMEVVAEASTGEEAVLLAEKLKPHVIVMDLKMPGIGGVASIQQIKERSKDSRVLIFTTYGEESDVVPALGSGADGYILKGSPAHEIAGSIRACARGESPLDPAVAKKLICRINKPQPAHESLSDREMEVLTLIAQGMKNKCIAEQLFITEKTVKAHVSHILTKLNVDDRTSAVTTALKLGIIEL